MEYKPSFPFMLLEKGKIAIIYEYDPTKLIYVKYLKSYARLPSGTLCDCTYINAFPRLIFMI